MVARVRLAWVVALASLLGSSLAAPPVGPKPPIQPNDFNYDSSTGRWQASETSKNVPGIDGKGGSTLDKWAQQGYDAVKQKEGANGGDPRPVAAQYDPKTGKVDYSSTSRGVKKPPMSEPYQNAVDTATKNKGQKCEHNTGGKCAEGGTTNTANKPVKGQQVSTYGPITTPGKNGQPPQKSEGTKPACSGDGANKLGCKNVLEHNQMHDTNHPNKGQQDAKQNTTPGLVNQRVGEMDPKRTGQARGQQAKNDIPFGNTKDKKDQLDKDAAKKQKAAENKAKNQPQKPAATSPPAIGGPPAPPLPGSKKGTPGTTQPAPKTGAPGTPAPKGPAAAPQTSKTNSGNSQISKPVQNAPGVPKAPPLPATQKPAGPAFTPGSTPGKWQPTKQPATSKPSSSTQPSSSSSGKKKKGKRGLQRRVARALRARRLARRAIFYSE